MSISNLLLGGYWEKQNIITGGFVPGIKIVFITPFMVHMMLGPVPFVGHMISQPVVYTQYIMNHPLEYH